MSGSRGSGPRPERGGEPWRPATFSLYGVYTRTRWVTVRAEGTGEKRRQAKKRYDVRFQVDGQAFRFGFDRKGWADAFAQQLQQDFHAGLAFDPAARRFIDAAPEPGGGTQTILFVEHARDYYRRQWHRWEPATRQGAQGPLSLACLHLLREDAPPLDGGERVRADAYLRRAVFIVPAPTHESGEDQAWATWFGRWSLPIDEVTDRHLRDFIDAYRSQALDGTPRMLKPSSVARTRAVVRAAFTNARQRQLLARDPWEGVEREKLRDHDQVDPDLVMDPAEVRALAAACAAIDERYRAYVLLQGVCGPRPGETTDLRRRDFAFDGPVPSVTMGGSRSEVPERFFIEGESRRRPLKGRGPKARRTVPLPAPLIPVLLEHLDRYVSASRDAYVFTTASGARITSSNFARDIWNLARAAAFDEQSPLRRVRRHDLRHSAITTWLNAGVPLKTAQRWSGHKTASVLLDTYLGVMKGDEDLALERLERALGKPNRKEGIHDEKP